MQLLTALFSGILLTLVTSPPGTVTGETCLALARALVTGVLSTPA